MKYQAMAVYFQGFPPRLGFRNDYKFTHNQKFMITAAELVVECRAQANYIVTRHEWLAEEIRSRKEIREILE